jgi:hypothetical protein
MRMQTNGLIALMTLQALLGLAWPTAYRDADWIKATWFGNDWITLLVAAPMMWGSRRMAENGSVRGELVSLGTVGYALYNYAFYLFGAALNVFLPLYVITLGMAIVTLASGLGRIDPIAIAASFNRGPWLPLVGGYLIFVACGLSVVWIGTWAAYVFAGKPTPVEPEAFKIVAALDLLWLVPSLAAGGALLWNRRPWGFVIATAASVQGAMYLLVLSVNSTIVIRRRLAASPGELPIWLPLTVCTAIAALALLNAAASRDVVRS